MIFILYLKRRRLDRKEDIVLLVLEKAHFLFIVVINLKVVYNEKQGVQQDSDCNVEWWSYAVAIDILFPFEDAVIL